MDETRPTGNRYSAITRIRGFNRRVFISYSVSVVKSLGVSGVLFLMFRVYL
jgi:hypothetical protein